MLGMRAPTPVFLPRESHEQSSLVGSSPWGREEPDTTEGHSLRALGGNCPIPVRIPPKWRHAVSKMMQVSWNFFPSPLHIKKKSGLCIVYLWWTCERENPQRWITPMAIYPGWAPGWVITQFTTQNLSLSQTNGVPSYSVGFPWSTFMYRCCGDGFCCCCWRLLKVGLRILTHFLKSPQLIKGYQEMSRGVLSGILEAGLQCGNPSRQWSRLQRYFPEWI